MYLSKVYFMESTFQVRDKYFFLKYTKLAIIFIVILVYYLTVYLFTIHFKYTFCMLYSSAFLDTLK